MSARSVILVHGAGSGPWVWDGWTDAFAMSVTALDLHRGRDVASTSMWDYAAAIYDAAEVLPTPLGLCGWGMGGLLVAMAARNLRPDAVVMIEPSPPAEVRGEDHDVPLERGTYDPEEVYGPFPPETAPRPESSLARAERQRGISVPSLPCRSLVVSGRRFGEERGRRIVELYGSEHLDLPDLDHFDLVLDPRVPLLVAEFLTS